MRRGPRIVLLFVLAVPLLAVLWAGFAPIHVASREKLFEIPKGTYARRSSGDMVEILPSEIRLTLGLQDVLLLRNLDEVPQVFGPSIMMPGQSLRLPFERAARYDFVCTAHVSGQLTILVEEEPVMPWSKIRWRVREWWENRKA
ncbi:MAG TPA: hypothetical protein VFV88_11040 [Steroidobacteraceae bacterium]|jgi:hypothetical protein|nr:hypothetical protein [Steroidobacteraceae bacterium]